MAEIAIIDMTDALREWVKEKTKKDWFSEYIVINGNIIYPHEHEGIIACLGKKRLGLLTYRVTDNDCEILTLKSYKERHGIGRTLLSELKKRMISENWDRLWLTTTNSNLPALSFYQKNGFHIIAVYPDQVNASRAIKPEIPLIGINGIPIRDEIVLEYSNKGERS